MRFKYGLIIFFVLCCLVLLAGIFAPHPPPRPFPNADKVEHFLAFFVASLSGSLLFRRWKPALLYWPLWLLAAYGLEHLQGALLVRRTFDLWDMYANGAGVLGAVLVWLIGVFVFCKNSKKCQI